MLWRCFCIHQLIYQSASQMFMICRVWGCRATIRTLISGESRGGWQGWSPPPPPWTCSDPENLCKVCVGPITHPTPWNVDDVTRAMSKGGGWCLWMSKRGGQFFGGWMTGGWSPRGCACECSQGGGWWRRPPAPPAPPPPVQPENFISLLGHPPTTCLTWMDGRPQCRCPNLVIPPHSVYPR